MDLKYLAQTLPQMRKKLRVREAVSIGPKLVHLLDTLQSSLTCCCHLVSFFFLSFLLFFVFFSNQPLFQHNIRNFMGTSLVS